MHMYILYIYSIHRSTCTCRSQAKVCPPLIVEMPHREVIKKHDRKSKSGGFRANGLSYPSTTCVLDGGQEPQCKPAQQNFSTPNSHHRSCCSSPAQEYSPSSPPILPESQTFHPGTGFESLDIHRFLGQPPSFGSAQ